MHASAMWNSEDMHTLVPCVPSVHAHATAMWNISEMSVRSALSVQYSKQCSARIQVCPCVLERGVDQQGMCVCVRVHSVARDTLQASVCVHAIASIHALLIPVKQGAGSRWLEQQSAARMHITVPVVGLCCTTHGTTIAKRPTY